MEVRVRAVCSALIGGFFHLCLASVFQRLGRGSGRVWVAGPALGGLTGVLREVAAFSYVLARWLPWSTGCPLCSLIGGVS